MYVLVHITIVTEWNMSVLFVSFILSVECSICVVKNTSFVMKSSLFSLFFCQVRAKEAANVPFIKENCTSVHLNQHVCTRLLKLLNYYTRHVLVVILKTQPVLLIQILFISR